MSNVDCEVDYFMLYLSSKQLAELIILGLMRAIQ